MNIRRLFTVLCMALLSLLLLTSTYSGWAAPSSPDGYPDYDERTQLPWRAAQQSHEVYATDLASSSELADWSKLIYQSYRNGNWDIYMANPGGANERRLTYNATADIHPRLDRGGTRVVFSSKRTGSYEVYVVNVDGTGLAQLTSTGRDNVNPAWSPGGERIAFQSYRDGQAEIYVMNADGSNQTRITWDAAYDGDPAWSPDGTRIAFVSNRTGGSRIWVMQADGSGAKQCWLSSTEYSQNPVWSPDGKSIAFDTDYDGDGWQEIVVIDPDAEPWSATPTIYDLNRDKTDAWVGGWSPDGNYIVFTQISFVYYYGYWYWTEAYVRAWPYKLGGQTLTLIPQNTEWSPDWQTLDIQPPVSALSIPAESPSPILVNYNAQDAGGSGVRSYDVQYRENVSGVWSDLLKEEPYMTPVYLPNVVGGQVFHFRMRARDNAYNVSAWSAEKVTTVESYPPKSQVDPLPPYIRYTGEGFPVTWSVYDPGGSDIVSLEVQYREDNQDWRNWQADVAPPVTFLGELGHTYAFRTRAVDRAQNIELWPEDDGDTQTTLYAWGITGKVTDNTGAPVSGAVISTTPAALKQFYSVANGDYGAYVAQNTAWYTFTMGKPGYAPMPSTTLPFTMDAELDMVLPPVDNVVRDWGFESGDMEETWNVSGFTLSVILPDPILANVAASPVMTEEVFLKPHAVSDIVHTGEHAAFAGLEPALLAHDFGLSNVIAPDFVFDAKGKLHLSYSSSVTGQLFYRSYDASVGWSDAEVVSSGGTSRIFVSGDNNIEIVYRHCEYGSISAVYATKRRSDGSWEIPYRLSSTVNEVASFDAAADKDGHIHVVWSEYTGGLYYREQDSSGNWLAELLLSGTMPSGWDVKTKILADNVGNIHVVYAFNDSLYHLYRSPIDVWYPVVKFANLNTSPTFEAATDNQGTLHIVWNDVINSDGNTTFPLYYTAFRSSAFTPPVVLSSGFVNYPKIVAGKANEVHVIWHDDNGFYHIHILEDGTWSKPVTICDVLLSYGESIPQAILDDDGVLYLAWGNRLSYYNWDWEVYYADWAAGRGWSEPDHVASTYLSSSSMAVHLLAQVGQRVHLFWQHGDGGYGLSQAAFPHANTNGVYSISQTVTVPLTMSTPTLSFLYHLGGVSDPITERFEVQVQDATESTLVFSTTHNTLAWRHQWASLAPWQGQVITLTFELYQSQNEMLSRVYLDEISLGSARPDVWVTGTDTSGLPGEPIAYHIDYGNQGGGTAQSVRITNTLPSGVTFIDASIPPLLATPSLVWDVGTLSPQSSASPIVVTVTLAPTVTAFATLTHTLEIAPQAIGLSGTLILDPGLVELETSNNVATAGIWMGKRVFLPLILKNR